MRQYPNCRSHFSMNVRLRPAEHLWAWTHNSSMMALISSLRRVADWRAAADGAAVQRFMAATIRPAAAPLCSTRRRMQLAYARCIRTQITHVSELDGWFLLFAKKPRATKDF